MRSAILVLIALTCTAPLAAQSRIASAAPAGRTLHDDAATTWELQTQQRSRFEHAAMFGALAGAVAGGVVGGAACGPRTFIGDERTCVASIGMFGGLLGAFAGLGIRAMESVSSPPTVPWRRVAKRVKLAPGHEGWHVGVSLDF